ncbi:hypothetical protein HDU87_008113 [Geranomyces variabilis]|uniref:ethanolamine kinase n=1 Tax=Geranomyces variabilis TaxID=109894 RepID=A0AAD5TU56_9FUNG|nr:hypothetical protein HDU87_008113 [Geranomyces variabilis]
MLADQLLPTEATKPGLSACGNCPRDHACGTVSPHHRPTSRRLSHAATAAEPSHKSTDTDRVRTFAYTVDHESLMPGVKAVVKHYFPSWDVEKDVKLVQCTAGITNKLVRCIHKPSDFSVLVRIYGKGSDVLIDRSQELLNLLTLSSLGLSPPIFGRFENGLVYGFVPGDQFSGEDMRDPHKGILVATQLARWHRVELPGTDATPKLFSTMWRWLEEVPEKYTDPGKNARFHQAFEMPALKRELAELQTALEAVRGKVGFCHNDLLSGNIIATTHGVEFIDYEYGTINYRAFDIANHFCEHAGFECEWGLYPAKEVQLPWLRTYLESSNRTVLVEDAEVEALYREVAKFSLAAHFFWAIWALVQAEISDLDFDYLEYSITRLQYMRTVKDAYLAL